MVEASPIAEDIDCFDDHLILLKDVHQVVAAQLMEVGANVAEQAKEHAAGGHLFDNESAGCHVVIGVFTSAEAVLVHGDGFSRRLSNRRGCTRLQRGGAERCWLCKRGSARGKTQRPTRRGVAKAR